MYKNLLKLAALSFYRNRTLRSMSAPNNACTPAKYAGAEQPDPRASTGIVMVGIAALKRSKLRSSQFRQSGFVSSRPPAGTLAKSRHRTPGRCAPGRPQTVGRLIRIHYRKVIISL